MEIILAKKEEKNKQKEKKKKKKNTRKKKKKKKKKRKEDSIRDLWEDTKCTNNIHILGVMEGEERKGLRKYEEIIAENFPNLEKETVTQVQETQSCTE